MRRHPLVRSSLSLAVITLFATGCAGIQGMQTPRFLSAVQITQNPAQTPVITAKLIRAYPHDQRAFTQGLEYFGGYLYESTGIAGQSTVRRVALETGEVLQKITLASQYFGEGLTIFHGKIYQLTWLSKKGFIYNLRSLRQAGEFSYDTQGWGLTHDEESLIMSDGTNTIRYLDPVSFAVTRTINVYSGGNGVVNLNELEYVNGEILANIWHSSRIARIDARSGEVLAWLDLSSIVSKEHHSEEAVLNGIAYDQAKGRLFVTGKNWSKVFEVKLESRTH